MIQPTEKRQSIRPRHTAGVVATVAVAAIVAFVALHAIVGLVWLVVKFAVVIAIGALAVKLIFRRRR